jgi:hypothetical protein
MRRNRKGQRDEDGGRPSSSSLCPFLLYTDKLHYKNGYIRISLQEIKVGLAFPLLTCGLTCGALCLTT